MAIVTFSPVDFRAAYPGFATLSDAQLNNAFLLSTLYLRNTDSSPVSDVTIRATLLNLLTAHIAALNYGENGAPPKDLAGRVSSASQGSVSVTLDPLPSSPGIGWFYQTRYGAQYWEATAPYRVARYVPGRLTRSY
ncbi:DUF4054 domain-containing protein [Bordetella sp. 02P26C-1]|uniref:DUF4054 domain-containing protein n=1 Tax=Bordetella sp. 02P26C-1 TaxID=2683195 RepID=UPI00135547F6|nr:DUF4054 domain-containing protein [Bordetella sp. 02P26C-1]MVW80181.1 DUF4054 domain-containing protein [Bordetella sp. 02P26C-1]